MVGWPMRTWDWCLGWPMKAAMTIFLTFWLFSCFFPFKDVKTTVTADSHPERSHPSHSRWRRWKVQRGRYGLKWSKALGFRWVCNRWVLFFLGDGLGLFVVGVMGRRLQEICFSLFFTRDRLLDSWPGQHIDIADQLLPRLSLSRKSQLRSSWLERHKVISHHLTFTWLVTIWLSFVICLPRHSTMAKWDHAEDTWFWDWDAKLAGKSQAGHVCSTWASFNYFCSPWHAPVLAAQTCCRGPCRLPEDDEGLCGPLLFDSDNCYSFCCDKKGIGMRHCFPAKDTVILPNIADWEEVGWDLLRCKRQKRVKGRHKVVYHRSKDISIPFPLDQPARLEDILRICLQRPMQRAFMQVVCRRSMVSWQFWRFLVAIKEHSDTPKRVTTRLLGCKCASFTDISIRCMAYPCLRRGGTGDSMDAWHRFIYNVPLLHWAQ